MKKVILLICCIFLISGCYDYKELNDMSIVSGIGIDYKDEKYIVNLEITKSTKEGTSAEIESHLVTGEADNIADAFTIAKNRSDKLVYMEHVEVLVLSKDICKRGINEVIDYIIRDTTINNNYFIVVTDNPSELFKITIDNQSASEVIINTVEYYFENTAIDDIDIIASNMVNKRDDIALPYIYTKEENIIFDEIAYFDDDKMVGLIDGKIYSFLELNSVNVNFNNNGNTIGIYKKDIRYEIKNKEVIIKVKAYGTVKEINDEINLKDPDSYGKLEKNISKTMEKEITEFIDNTLNDKSDLLGLEDKYYKKYKKDIDNIKYKVDVELIVNRNGTIYGVLNDN